MVVFHSHVSLPEATFPGNGVSGNIFEFVSEVRPRLKVWRADDALGGRPEEMDCRIGVINGYYLCMYVYIYKSIYIYIYIY